MSARRVHTNSVFPLIQDFQSKELPNTRIQPDRRWFGNTRVVGQKQLEQFREQMSSKVNILLIHSFVLYAGQNHSSCKIT